MSIKVLPFPAAAANATPLDRIILHVQRRPVAADPLRRHLWGHLQNLRDKIVGKHPAAHLNAFTITLES
jgi:hypothetical protein